MISEIQGIVGPMLGTAYVSASASNDIFEAYTFALIVKAAKDEGANVSYFHRDGSVASSLIFRNGPGLIYSNVKNYTHALVEFSGQSPLEVHVGVKVAGKSGVLHEADVAVIVGAEAENCRQNSISPRSSKTIILAECKYYASSLNLGLARGFVGLVTDMSVKYPYFVTNTSSASVEKLLSHRVKYWEKNVSPICLNDEVERLVYSFRNAFKYYNAM